MFVLFVSDVIIKKWNNLKSYFGSLARKASLKNSKSGQATSDNFAYWPHYERLTFLKDVFEQTETVDNMIELDVEDINESREEEYLVDDLQDIENPSDQQETRNPTRNSFGRTRKRLNNLGEPVPVVIDTTQSTKRRRVNRDDAVATTLSVVTNTLSNINNNRNPPVNNRAVAYGNYLGQVLQSFSDELQMSTINKINKIVYEAERENLL